MRDELLAIARALRLSNRDEIARVWLEYALAAHRRGEIVYPAPAVAANGKLTLFPEDGD